MLRSADAFERRLDETRAGEPEIYKYQSFDGVKIEAALVKPADWTEKQNYRSSCTSWRPHGAWEDTVDAWSQLLAARGFAVVLPNIRGSIGYGQKFVEMNRGDWGAETTRM